MSSLLEIDSVRKSYELNRILSDIYLKCETGDILGILGRNGSGKSTLLKILFGTLAAESKFIRIDGRIFNNPYRIKDTICLLPQFNFLPKYLTVERAAKLYICPSYQSEFLDDERLFPYKKYKVSKLSGGDQRYFEVKLVLNLNSKFVLLDEPFNGASPLQIEKIKELIISASQHKGIILTDQDYRNVLDVANRFCLIYDGGLRKTQNIEDIISWGYLPQKPDQSVTGDAKAQN